tara:strand:+ start:2755 stop:3741 length:987 start_codon:yes stop_codon:yes gene_type:complete
MDKRKPFLTKSNPLNYDHSKSENFSLKYLLPTYWITWIGILFSLLLIITPQNLRIVIGKFIGLCIYTLNKKRVDIAKTNIKMCFPTMDDISIRKMTHKYFSNLGRAFADFPILLWRRDEVVQKMIEVKGIENISNELSKGKGVIVLTAHSVSLDFAGRSLSKYPIISIYKPFRNELVNWFVGRSRSKETDSASVFPRDNFPFKDVLQALKKPNVFFYVGDEDLGYENSEFADFFGQKKSTLVAIRKIVEITNCSVVPVLNLFDSKSKKYITYVDKPLSNFPSGSIIDDARLINFSFEKLITIEKAEYMWSLRFFQTRPRNVHYPYKKL